MLSRQQEIDSKMCELREDMECSSCSCNVCVVQQRAEYFTIKDLAREAHKNAVRHGFWNDFRDIDMLREDGVLDEHYECVRRAFISQFLMLIIGEVSEALEALREGDVDNVGEELADVVIRTADLCGGLNIDLESEIKKKMEKNKTREFKHGKLF